SESFATNFSAISVTPWVSSCTPDLPQAVVCYGFWHTPTVSGQAGPRACFYHRPITRATAISLAQLCRPVRWPVTLRCERSEPRRMNGQPKSGFRFRIIIVQVGNSRLGCRRPSRAASRPPQGDDRRLYYFFSFL